MRKKDALKIVNKEQIIHRDRHTKDKGSLFNKILTMEKERDRDKDRDKDRDRDRDKDRDKDKDKDYEIEIKITR